MSIIVLVLICLQKTEYGLGFSQCRTEKIDLQYISFDDDSLYRKHCHYLLQTNVAYAGSISRPEETPKPEEHLLKEAIEEVIARKNGDYWATTTPAM